MTAEEQSIETVVDEETVQAEVVAVEAEVTPAEEAVAEAVDAPETAEAIIESSSWLQEGAPLNRNLELLPKWWGRGQQYLSFIRKSNKK